ncbi:hypothetical protein ACTI_67030 [Actinoplanes sp. OR16]|uniref:hypothetical protein n=1 Tax=Actinoplanes sp. OR16 TaxID=946334 RepID=UPI000F6DD73F|nr:hypothetical protein [Actinoplanes sp. OR16]BBH70018.1 hypothetical protein ACTI_67030 [Actinoplanes sp. OR16]
MTSEYVVVLAADADHDRVGQLVGDLGRRGLTVVAEDAVPVIGIFPFLHDAAAIVVAFGGPVGAAMPSIAAEIDRVVPVRLTETAQPPDPIARLTAIDLGSGADRVREFTELLRRLAALVDDSRNRRSPPRPPDDADEVVIGAPLYAVDELQRLAAGVRDVASLLAGDADGTRQVRATLDEIGGSYRVVLSAIDTFHAAGADPGRIDLKALATLRGGALAERIHNGRGHCKRIGARYYADGGMRSALAGRVPAVALRQADATFMALTYGDLDMFDELDAVGWSLTRQSRDMFSLATAGQPAEAQRRFEQAREELAPIEEALHRALRDFQDIEQSLGYAQDAPPEVVPVTDESINFYGPVTNAVIARTISESRITLQAAALQPDLKNEMEQLLTAVKEMSQQLSPDDAVAVAAELEQLTNEVASDQPRPGIVRKCLRSLEQFGKTVADVGVPVIDLATKIAAFF